MDVDKIKLQIIKAGEKAVKQLIKVAEEDIIKYGEDDELAADKLKNAAATKKLAIFDAFEILNRIEDEENILNDKPREDVKEKTFSGFAEKRSK
jgi:ASC-1-like (ASCH) protein